MTRAALSQMLKQGKGAIVNISSIASLVGLPTLPVYAASKGALDAITRALAVDYAKEGIRCNVVNPGLIDTPMAAPLSEQPRAVGLHLSHYPIRRAGKPEEVATWFSRSGLRRSSLGHRRDLSYRWRDDHLVSSRPCER